MEGKARGNRKKEGKWEDKRIGMEGEGKGKREGKMEGREGKARGKRDKENGKRRE